ncbi:ABC transporter permease subunit [Pseudoclavibacter chungangensis]|uniref:ABC transporter permease subunit n=1 Tax=Pseudoclavibacter chungangensis TaxID=587635 RepID=A0A7J5BPV9_9MICO|nr:ABC transporter permease subunit [Pseudoclavibacter chungangensis]KAB1655350.1 ABC transporter permease subunit [Pseudoclavibacter chungangensis]NYJ68300.1 D-methionine transport system permease protein [Pseudoclavibacter chungangensis]
MFDLYAILPQLLDATWQTLYIVILSMIFGGFGGLVIGLTLYLTRPGNLYDNPVVFTILNVIVNVVRPVPFILLLVLLQPLARSVMGVGIGNPPVIFAISIAAIFGISRLVEQNLVTVSPGVIEAARAVGASRFRIVWSVIVPEGLGPLILGYTYAFVALVDMSAVAGWIGGGGLGTYAVQTGWRQLDYGVMVAAVVVIIIIVQLAQFLGNWIAKSVLRR